jgi:heme oxygenase
MNLREATAELHRTAEQMEFNQKMFRGELSLNEYVKYLETQYSIFEKIERLFTLPDPNLARANKVKEDLYELGETNPYPTDKAMEYTDYLSTLDSETILPHIYLNYLALAYGGQMMKTKVPGSGRMYDFENMHEAIGAIRAVQQDEWADEVNKGFEYIITILDELQNTTGSNS